MGSLTGMHDLYNVGSMCVRPCLDPRACPRFAFEFLLTVVFRQSDYTMSTPTSRRRNSIIVQLCSRAASRTMTAHTVVDWTLP